MGGEAWGGYSIDIVCYGTGMCTHFGSDELPWTTGNLPLSFPDQHSRIELREHCAVPYYAPSEYRVAL